MDGQRRFAVIGTDARLAAAGRALARAGFAVGGPEQTALADYILLPLPLDESRTPLAELLRAAKPGALALGGKLSAQARQIAAEAGVELVDYFAREELILCNAIPTAEGCIGILMAERTRTLWNSAILLAGFGPVGQALGVRLAALGAAVAQAEQLVRQGWELLPVMSYAASGLNTRFGRADEWKDRLETLTGHRVLDTLQDVEPLGPRQLARALVVAPCTGTTLARLAAGLSDTPVTLAAKSLLRVGCPVLLAVSTNDGLGASGENIARLMQRKHYYFVPYGQDDAAQKPQSLKADLTLLPAALEAALRGQQLQPVLREWN